MQQTGNNSMDATGECKNVAYVCNAHPCRLGSHAVVVEELKARHTVGSMFGTGLHTVEKLESVFAERRVADWCET